VIVENPQILSDKRAVGLVCKPGRTEIAHIAERIVELLVSKDLEIQVDPGSINLSNTKVKPTLIEEMDVDFVITIGGDGYRN